MVQIRTLLTLLLLSDDQTLAALVARIVKRPWKLIRHGAVEYETHKMFSEPNVRLVVFDDQAVAENDRSWLLGKIRKHFSGAPLLYIAARHSDGNEKRARTNGAHYYISKPLAPERFGDVLRSFLQAQPSREQPLHLAEDSRIAMSVQEPTRPKHGCSDTGIQRLSDELNREDSRLRSYLLDAALAGLRLTRNPESRELGADTFRIWQQIAPILSRHLDTEDTKLLPWLERQGARSSTVGGRAREYHHQLRTLMGAIANSGADHLTEAQARDAGQAMSGLAVSLDDAIDDEERRLFPMIRKALFASARRG